MKSRAEIKPPARTNKQNELYFVTKMLLPFCIVRAAAIVEKENETQKKWCNQHTISMNCYRFVEFHVFLSAPNDDHMMNLSFQCNQSVSSSGQSFHRHQLRQLYRRQHLLRLVNCNSGCRCLVWQKFQRGIFHDAAIIVWGRISSMKVRAVFIKDFLSIASNIEFSTASIASQRKIRESF